MSNRIMLVKAGGVTIEVRGKGEGRPILILLSYGRDGWRDFDACGLFLVKSVDAA
jgi:hypothetical protein